MLLLCAAWLLVDSAPALPPSSPRPQPTAPAARPLDSYPAIVRPLLKYGVGGVVAAWFLFGIGWLCWKRLYAAKTNDEHRLARRWVAGMFLGVGLALLIVAIGLVLWLRSQHLLMLFVAGPAAVLLPPICARWLEGKSLPEVPAAARKIDTS